MPINAYSTTPGDNNGVGYFPEGMNPSALNDGCRQVMADIKTMDLDAFWRNLGNPSGTKTGTYLSTTQFQMTGNQTGDYHVGRRIRMEYASFVTKYGVITASSYDSGPALTTVTVQTDDNAALSNEVSTPSVGPPVTNATTPQVANAYYSGSGTVRLVEMRVNGTSVGGIDWNGSTLSLVTD